MWNRRNCRFVCSRPILAVCQKLIYTDARCIPSWRILVGLVYIHIYEIGSAHAKQREKEKREKWYSRTQSSSSSFFLVGDEIEKRKKKYGRVCTYIYICGYRDSTEAHSCSRLDLQNSVSYIHLRPVVNRRCCYSTAGFSQSQMLYNRGITLYAPRVLLDVCFSLPPSVSFFSSSPPRGKKGRIFMDRAVNSST